MINSHLLKKKTWLITGVAGFIGSNILKELLINNQNVIGLDNFYSGNKKNLLNVKKKNKKFLKNFKFFKIDIRDKKKLKILSKMKIDYVIHLAALVSVPVSIQNPILCEEINVKGFENIIQVLKNKKIKKIVYASSAAVYGNTNKKNSENDKLKPLSPYAISKIKNEMYAKKMSKKTGIKFVGLRYFNIFGNHQNVKGSYASVIPKWIKQIKNNKKIFIYGDGKNQRDFCHVDNVVLANLLAATKNKYKNKVYNVASGKSITLLYLIKKFSKLFNKKIIHSFKAKKKGDIKISKANIEQIKLETNFKIVKNLDQGLIETVKNF